MAKAEITEFGDWLVEYLGTFIQSISESGDPEITIERVYEMVENIGNVDGRHIHIFTVSYTDGGPAARRDSYVDITLVIDCIERYPQEGKYTVEWADGRVGFVEQVFNELSDSKKRFGPEQSGEQEYWCQTIENQNVADEATLRENDVFWSRIEVTYRRTK